MINRFAPLAKSIAPPTPNKGLPGTAQLARLACSSTSNPPMMATSICFPMIRGKHIDVAIMGGLEVDEQANLANWAVPGKPLLGVGGAMDLASGAKRLIITMTHTNSDGSSKIVPECTLPLTAMNAVEMIITELAVFAFQERQLTLIEIMAGATLEEVRAKTAAKFVESIREYKMVEN